MKFDSAVYEVDASISQKIMVSICDQSTHLASSGLLITFQTQATLREETMAELRNYLHKALMIGLRGEDVWLRLGGMDMSQSERCVSESE